MAENKRKARRIAVDWTLELTNRSGDSIRSRIINISETGILFMSPHPFHANEFVGMVVVVRTTCQIRCVARIIRELPGSSRFATYAAEFFRFADNGQVLLKETLSEAIKRIPEEKFAMPETAVKTSPKAAEPVPPVTEPNLGPRREPSPVVIRR